MNLLKACTQIKALVMYTYSFLGSVYAYLHISVQHLVIRLLFINILEEGKKTALLGSLPKSKSLKSFPFSRLTSNKFILSDN